MRVGQCASQQRLYVVRRKRLELEHLAAADQRAVDGKEGVGRGGADQRDDAFLHVGQQNVLLRLAETMDFVDKQDGLPAAGSQLVPSLVHQGPQFLHARSDRTQLAEVASPLGRQQPGQRCLSRSRWTVEDHRSQPVRLQQAAEQLAFAQKVPLANKFVQRNRPHPCCEGLSTSQIVGFRLFEQRLFGHHFALCETVCATADRIHRG